MHKNRNTNCQNIAQFSRKNGFKASRLVYDIPPRPSEVDPRLHVSESSKENELIAKHLGDETFKKLDELNKSLIFGPIFKQMLDDRVQFQDWTGDTSQAERDMRKYFNNSDVPQDIRDLWFDKPDSVFTKLGKAPTSTEYKEGLAALTTFRKLLVDDHLHRTQEMVRSEQERLSKEPVLEKGKEFIGNLVDGFKDGDATDKIIMIAGAYMLFQGLGKLRKKTLPGAESMTWGDAMTWGGLYLGANLISLKSTGKSLGEHIGISDPKSDLDKTEYEKFARDFNIEDPKELELMLRAGNLDIEALYKLYISPFSEVEEGNSMQWIDPYAAGIKMDLGNERQQRAQGARLYKIMNALVKKAGGRKEFERKYIDRKIQIKDPTVKGKTGVKHVNWTFRAVAWDIMRNDSLRRGLSPMEQIYFKAKRRFFGREAMPLDAYKARREFPFPQSWSVEFSPEDKKQGDEKSELTINGVPMIAERTRKRVPMSGKVEHHIAYKFTIKGTNISKIVTLTDKPGKQEHEIDPREIKLVDAMITKNVHDRVVNTAFVAGPPPVTLNKKIAWKPEKGGWIYEGVSLPAIPSLGLSAVPKADLIVRPKGTGTDVDIDIKGAGVNINLRLTASQEGYQKDRVKNAIVSQAKPGRDFTGLAPIAAYLKTEIVPTTPLQVKLTVDGSRAPLPLEFDTAAGEWKVVAIGGNPPSQVEKAFAQDPAVAKALGKVETLDRNSDLNIAIQEMKDIFEAMPEEFFKHGFRKFLDIFRKASVNSPFKGLTEFAGSGISGSMKEYYVQAIAKLKKEEIAMMYEYMAGNATSVANLSTIKQQVLDTAIKDIQLINADLKAKAVDARNNDKSFDEKDFQQMIERYMGVGYKSTFYRTTVLDFAKNAFAYDKEGLDMSDWSKAPHAVQAKMMQVIIAHTKEAAANTQLDDTDFMRWARLREARENAMGYNRRLPKSSPHNRAVLSLAATDATWRSHKAQEDMRIKNFHQQAYVEYVVNQVTFKSHAWGAKNSAIDETLSNIPGPHSGKWKIMDYNAFVRNGNRVTKIEALYKMMPKLNKLQVQARLYRVLDNDLYNELKRTGKYRPSKLRAIIAKLKRNRLPHLIPMDKVVDGIAGLPNRADQEMSIKAFARAARILLENPANLKRRRQVKSIWKHMGEWLTDAYHFIKFW